MSPPAHHRTTTDPAPCSSQSDADIRPVGAAVYLAVEGAPETPALVGVLVDGDFETFVCDPVLKPAAAEKALPFLEIADLADMLAARCRSDDRQLIGWSDSVLAAFPPATRTDLSPVFREARAIAAAWMARCHPDQPTRDWRLTDLLPLVDFPRSSHLGYGKSAKRLRAVRSMIARKGSFEQLTGTVKGQWTKLLQHNETECRGMEAVVTTAAAQSP